LVRKSGEIVHQPNAPAAISATAVAAWAERLVRRRARTVKV
jgi:hypothetical protein